MNANSVRPPATSAATARTATKPRSLERAPPLEGGFPLALFPAGLPPERRVGRSTRRRIHVPRRRDRSLRSPSMFRSARGVRLRAGSLLSRSSPTHSSAVTARLRCMWRSSRPESIQSRSLRHSVRRASWGDLDRRPRDSGSLSKESSRDSPNVSSTVATPFASVPRVVSSSRSALRRVSPVPSPSVTSRRKTVEPTRGPLRRARRRAPLRACRGLPPHPRCLCMRAK